jgi:O-antigen/teichoic acid export membrane protein
VSARAAVGRFWSSSLLRNSVLIMATTVVNSLLGYAYWLVAARSFTAAEIGVASAVVGVMTIASVLSNMGAAPALIQRLPGRVDGPEWSTTLSASLAGGFAIGCAAGVVLVAALPLLSSPLAAAASTTGWRVAIVAGVGLWTVSTVLDYAFIAERATGNMLARGCAFGLIKIPLLFLPAGLAGGGALTIFVSWVAGSALSSLIGVAILVPRLRRTFRPTLRGVGTELRAMTRLLLGNHVVTLGNMLPVYLLPVVVVTRLSPEDNAAFYVTWMLGGAFFMISSAIGSSLFAEGSCSEAQIGSKLALSLRVATGLLVPAMLLFLVAGDLMLSLFGGGYAEAGSVLLVVLTASAMPDAITNLYVAALRVEGRMQAAGALTVGMAATTLVLAWALLPELGIAGAGWAWLAAKAAGSCWVGLDVLRRRSGAGVLTPEVDR